MFAGIEIVKTIGPATVAVDTAGDVYVVDFVGSYGRVLKLPVDSATPAPGTGWQVPLEAGRA
ncbi:MAG: hypothetical protein ACRDTO_10680 [Mycobacterium sp.]